MQRWKWIVALLLATGLVWASPPDDDDDDEVDFDFAADAVMGAYAPAPSMEMGATPGGAQNIGYARDRIAAGEIPHARTFTPEGLFSEHDLPLPPVPCEDVLCLTGAATRADLLAQPEVRAIAQLGFASGLDPRTWRRAPLNLVAVVDKSGSMSGTPLDTVKASLHQLVDQLGAGDQLAVVLYGDRTHVHLSPTRASDKAALRGAIGRIASAGSTNMEAGLRLGFEVARKSADGFAGTTRVMLFTDERPNLGRTDADSFMGMARENSKRGVGLTTVGVSTHFGAELATAISSVRGGNLFFFPDVAKMRETFTDELDTMVTELAWDLRLELKAAPGWTIAGLYGIPGDLVQRGPDGTLSLTIETVFLSRRKGAIFLALAPEVGAVPSGGVLASAHLSWQGTDGRTRKDAVRFTEMDGPLPLGLARGRLLVDEITTLKKAAALHLEQNDQEGAFQLVRALRQRLEQSGVSGLAEELATVAKLDETLTSLSGHRGEAPVAIARDPVTGLPR